jgi:GAF domain-containing protein
MPAKPEFFKTMCGLTQAFGMARNRNELLDLILRSAVQTLKGKAACLYLAQPGKEELRPVAQQGLSDGYFRSRKSRLTRKIVPLVMEEGFFYSPDAAADPRLEFPAAKKAEGIAAILAVPVVVKGRTIGIFCLFTDSPREFSQEETQFLIFLAQQGGGVMEHARLIDQWRSETKLLFDLAVNLSGSLDVKEILRAMSTDIAVALGVKGASIRLLDSKRPHWLLRAGDEKPSATSWSRLECRRPHRKMNKEEGIVTILSVPIKTKEKVIGVLRLYSGVKRNFTRDEIMLVTALAYLGGLAIQNASLYLMSQTDIKDLKDELWSHRSWF